MRNRVGKEVRVRPHVPDQVHLVYSGEGRFRRNAAHILDNPLHAAVDVTSADDDATLEFAFHTNHEFIEVLHLRARGNRGRGLAQREQPDRGEPTGRAVQQVRSIEYRGHCPERVDRGDALPRSVHRKRWGPPHPEEALLVGQGAKSHIQWDNVVVAAEVGIHLRPPVTPRVHNDAQPRRPVAREGVVRLTTLHVVLLPAQAEVDGDVLARAPGVLSIHDMVGALGLKQDR